MVNLIAAEWTKIRSVRSTYLTIAGSALATVAIAVMVSRTHVNAWNQMTARDRAAMDPVAMSFDGFVVAQLVMAALGVLAISSEYSTGLIRTTLAAAPRRLGVLAAKAAVCAAVALTAGEIIAFTAYALTQTILSTRHAQVGLLDPTGLRAVLAAGTYLLVVVLVGLGIGTALRHTGGALTLVFFLLFLLPQLVHQFPDPWHTRLNRLMLPTAAQQIVAQHPSPNAYGLAGSCAVLAGWVILTTATAAATIHHRDA